MIGGEVTLGEEPRSARRSINLILNDWQNRGVCLWTTNTTIVSIAASVSQVSLGSHISDVMQVVINRDRLFDIRGVDIRLTLTTKDNFFTRTPRNKRKPIELLSERKASTNTTTTGTGTTNTNNTIAAGATGDLKLRDSVVVTVYARNIGKDLFQ